METFYRYLLVDRPNAAAALRRTQLDYARDRASYDWPRSLCTAGRIRHCSHHRFYLSVAAKSTEISGDLRAVIGAICPITHCRKEISHVVLSPVPFPVPVFHGPRRDGCGSVENRKRRHRAAIFPRQMDSRSRLHRGHAATIHGHTIPGLQIQVKPLTDGTYTLIPVDGTYSGVWPRVTLEYRGGAKMAAIPADMESYPARKSHRRSSLSPASR